MTAVGNARLEALGDVAGVCDLSLERAVVQYRPAQEFDPIGEAIDDLGLALVLEGECTASAEVLDLGSGRIRHLDLGAELVVLDWVYEVTLDYVRMLRGASGSLASTGGPPAREPLGEYCRAIALSVLRRIGFNPLTRPTFLRVGFRDIVRDLDPNEQTAVRIALATGDPVAVRLNYDHNTLVFDRRRPEIDPDLERLLLDSFPAAEVRRTADGGYQLRFALPLSIAEARELIDEIRQGLLDLYACLEPERYHAVRHGLDVFGPRNTLAQLERWDRPEASVRLRLLSGSPSVGASTVVA